MLCFYCTQTHKKLQSEFSREFLATIFARLPAPSAPPRYTSATDCSAWTTNMVGNALTNRFVVRPAEAKLRAFVYVTKRGSCAAAEPTAAADNVAEANVGHFALRETFAPSKKMPSPTSVPNPTIILTLNPAVTASPNPNHHNPKSLGLP